MTQTKKVAANVRVRTLTIDDIEAVQAIHRACFPGIAPWTAEQLLSQLERFPEGQIGVEVDGVLVATSSSLILDGTVARRPHRFTAISGSGKITNHDPDGDVLYGIDIAVDPKFRGMRLSRRMYEARKAIVYARGLRAMLIAGRMARFRKNQAAMTPEEYVRRVLARDLRDPNITAQIANGFRVIGVLRDYLPSDVESSGNAVLMEWINPDVAPADGHVVGGQMRVASVQYQMRNVASFEEFGRQVAFFVDTASEYRCDVVLFPELLTTQLLSLVPAPTPALAARRLSEFTDRYLELFRDLAVRFHVNVIAGSHLHVEDGQLLNI
jgi:ribosomal protein S18 acetylase RimI-like enzyme